MSKYADDRAAAESAAYYRDERLDRCEARIAELLTDLFSLLYPARTPLASDKIKALAKEIVDVGRS